MYTKLFLYIKYYIFLILKAIYVFSNFFLLPSIALRKLYSCVFYVFFYILITFLLHLVLFCLILIYCFEIVEALGTQCLHTKSPRASNCSFYILGKFYFPSIQKNKEPFTVPYLNNIYFIYLHFL